MPEASMIINRLYSQHNPPHCWESSLRLYICHTWRTGRFTGDSIIFLHSKQDMSDMKRVQEMWNTDQKKINNNNNKLHFASRGEGESK